MVLQREQPFQTGERGVMANGKESRSAVDGELVLLRNMDIGVIHPYETVVGQRRYSYCAIFYISENGEWGEKTISGDKELILRRMAIVLFHQKSWEACRLAQGKGYCHPVDLGHGNLFIQVRGQSKTDFYNLKFYVECCERSNSTGLTEILMKGNRVFFSTSKKETIEKKRVRALQLVRKKLYSQAHHLEEMAAEYGYPDLLPPQGKAIENREPAESETEAAVPVDVSMIPLQGVEECDSADEKLYQEEPRPVFHVEESPGFRNSTEAGESSTIQDMVESYIPEEMVAQGKWMVRSNGSSSPSKKRCRFLRNEGELENRAARLYEDLLSVISG